MTFLSPKPFPGWRLAPALLLVVGAGCTRRQPVQVLEPVRMELPAAPAASATRPADATENVFYTTNHIDWPGPNQYRSSNGAPGPQYWQQRADYTIDATLDTATQTVSGAVTIRYTNNSPDTLRFLWLQLEQNLYRPGSWGSAMNPASGRWGARNFQGGYDLSDVSVDGRAVSPAVSDTRVRLDLDRPLGPKGGVATVAMKFRFRVPEHGSDRLARDGNLYEIAQWYPRMFVYDDVRGWNADPYLGQGEFYLEYGDYDFSVTAPAGFTVAASGLLQNPAEVLTAEQRDRLARAARSETVVPIITATESAPHPVSGTKTWRFRARNVHDVAWAAAPDFRWDAVSTGPIEGNAQGVLAQAYYSWPRAGAGWENGAENTQWTIRTYSKLFFPFPWPQATSVAGTVGGMEYPMFVMVHYAAQPQGAFGTIDHEHGHEWFPMIVGSNERRYAWMDEGFNTYINAFSNERRKPGSSAWTGYLDNWRSVRERGLDSPLITRPDYVQPAALGAIGYRKPAAVLLTLRNHVVGPETFDLAFREYARRWAFKHPTPGDFFRTIENVSGLDLSWYWRSFFYTDDVLDIGIDSVLTRPDSGGRTAVVALHQHTTIPFPVRLRLKLADGTTKDVSLPVDVWSRGRTFDAEFAVASNVVGARLWPDPSVPDWNPTNDTWGDAPAADPLGPVTRGGLATPVPVADGAR